MKALEKWIEVHKPELTKKWGYSKSLAYGKRKYDLYISKIDTGYKIEVITEISKTMCQITRRFVKTQKEVKEFLETI